MKVTGQSSLIAAQQMGLQRTSAEAKTASAAFFAELKKSTPAASAPAPTTENAQEPQINKISSMREAPMRGVQTGAPLPPGSLLNIVV
jgi:hypothetical protein